ncbi:metal ABC transporter substrate-binding protein [Corynebacterium sp. ACRPH]|uniref:metal ABC transporter substrate-binding protein n=1 Tax=Corynebacterium sp. ACRPH TaxID=2918199 RepID=UPI001EF269D8|nr:metal ABC transporter substrate-binding protein [Corynebacterium sp. ACRPH]MCG7457024.1 metal ABC transporter substrate-binding protein [Corynebacterium sp. ACRPH]
MKNTKRLIATLFTITLASAGATACSDADQHDKAEVLTTFTILEDITSNIAGDTLTVRSLTQPGAEVHGYDPTPSDIAAASDAELIINNGLGLEHWLDKLTADSNAQRVTASDGVDPIKIKDTDQPNPHAWMSPTLAKVYVDNIVQALSDLRPDNAKTYEDNGKKYKERLSDVESDLQDGLKALPRHQRALMTCEGAFSYLTEDMNMKEGYIWPVNTEGEITSQQITQAADFVRDNDVPAVFCESTVEPGPKEQLMRDTGARDGGTLYVDSLSEADGPVPTYLDLLSYDARTIVNGLTRKDAK